jgi:Family of unknown function (DUF6069)
MSRPGGEEAAAPAAEGAPEGSPEGSRHRHPDGRPDVGRLVGIGLLAVLLAVVVNVILARLAAGLFDAPPGFAPLRGGAVVFLTVTATALGVAVFIVLVLTTRRPGRWFRVAAYGTALVSCASPVSLLLSDPPRVAGVTGPLVAGLIPLHLAPALILVGLLCRRGWPEG